MRIQQQREAGRLAQQGARPDNSGQQATGTPEIGVIGAAVTTAVKAAGVPKTSASVGAHTPTTSPAVPKNTKLVAQAETAEKPKGHLLKTIHLLSDDDIAKELIAIGLERTEYLAKLDAALTFVPHDHKSFSRAAKEICGKINFETVTLAVVIAKCSVEHIAMIIQEFGTMLYEQGAATDRLQLRLALRDGLSLTNFIKAQNPVQVQPSVAPAKGAKSEKPKSDFWGRLFKK